MLIRTQAGPCITVKHEQEEVSRNHIQTHIIFPVHPRIVGALRLIARALAKSGTGVVGCGWLRLLALPKASKPREEKEGPRSLSSLVRCLFISELRSGGRRKVAFKGMDR